MKRIFLAPSIFIKYHINKRLLSVAVFFLITIILYNLIFLEISELFSGASKIGIIINDISISILSAYIFNVIVYEIPSFQDKSKIFMSFFSRRDNLNEFINRLLSRLKTDKSSWGKLNYEEQVDIINSLFSKNVFIEGDFKNEKLINETISSELNLISEEFTKIQAEFKNLTIHSKYLSSKILFAIVAIQEYRLFESTSDLHNLYGMIEIEKWDKDIFKYEYASILNDLVKIENVLSKEINPYWTLIKDKTIDDFLR